MLMEGLHLQPTVEGFIRKGLELQRKRTKIRKPLTKENLEGEALQMQIQI